MPKFPEGKELLLTDMVDTRGIQYSHRHRRISIPLVCEYTLAPCTKGKSDLWKHFILRKRKTDGRIEADVAVCKQCNSIVKLAGGTANMSTRRKRHHPLLLLGSPMGNKRTADTLVRISQYKMT